LLQADRGQEPNYGRQRSMTRAIAAHMAGPDSFVNGN
jgi:hypothetical protein